MAAMQPCCPRRRVLVLVPRLRRFCIALTGSPLAGDELAHSTVDCALERIDEWRQTTPLASWVYRIAWIIDAGRPHSRSSPGCGIDLARPSPPRADSCGPIAQVERAVWR